MARIMEAQSSSKNWEEFVFLEEGINAVKAKLWAYYQQVEERAKQNELTQDDTDYRKVLTAVRVVINVFNCMNHRDEHASWTRTANNIHAELVRADEAWIKHSDDPSSKTDYRPSTQFAEYWDESRAHF